MSEKTADYDSPWKEALEVYFEPFLRLCFPEAHAGIDWERGVEFLDKELQQIIREAESGRRYVDKLVKVWRRDGEEAWVLIHVEVQAQKDEGFPARMYRYHYRIYDRYGRQVVSLGVLADVSAKWRPNRFEYALWGCRLSLQSPVIKLRDLKTERLEADPNPFAVVVLAHLQALATRRKPEDRYRWKLRLVKSLYERGFTRQQILDLFRFIDWLLVLPVELEEGFREELARYEEEGNMPYVTSIERMAIERGRQEGLEEGLGQGLVARAREDVIEVLRLRFPQAPAELFEQLQSITDEGALRDLLRAAVTADSLEAFRATLEGSRSPGGES